MVWGDPAMPGMSTGQGADPLGEGRAERWEPACQLIGTLIQHKLQNKKTS